MRSKVLVKGPILSRSGYGEHARFVLRSLRDKQDELDIYVHPLNWGKTGWLYESSEERQWFDSLIQKTLLYHSNKDVKYDAAIQVTIPNEWERMAPINIGVTAGIETDRVSPVWIEKSMLMNKIIVPSSHSKNTYKNTSYKAQNPATGEDVIVGCGTPIDVVPYPVKEIVSDEVNLEIETDFNFLVLAQWGPRKNITDTVQWFVEEFIDQDVGLIIKTNIMKNSLMDCSYTKEKLQFILQKYKNRKCKVYLLHGDMTDEQVNSLYHNEKIKAMVSLTHGEGYGLPLFEAAYNGMPIVTCNWSGHVDFLNMPVKSKKGKTKDKAMFAKVDYKMGPISARAVWDGIIEKGTNWCYPEQGSYKMKLREVYKDYGRFKSTAKKLQKHIKKEFSQEKVYKSMSDSLMELIPRPDIKL